MSGMIDGYRNMFDVAIKAKDVFFRDGNLEAWRKSIQPKEKKIYPLHKYFVSESYKSMIGDDSPVGCYACIIQEPGDYAKSIDRIKYLQLSLSTLFQEYLNSDNKSDVPISYMIIGIPERLFELLPEEKRRIELINYHGLFKYVRDTVLSSKKNFKLIVKIKAIKEEIENVNATKNNFDTEDESHSTDFHTYRGFKPDLDSDLLESYSHDLNSSYNLITIYGEYEKTSDTCTLYGSFDPYLDKQRLGLYISPYVLYSFKININLQFRPPLYDEIKDNGYGELRNKYAENPFQDFAIYNFDSTSDFKRQEIDGPYPNALFGIKCNCPIHFLKYDSLNSICSCFKNFDLFDADLDRYSKRKKSMTIKDSVYTGYDVLQATGSHLGEDDASDI